MAINVCLRHEGGKEPGRREANLQELMSDHVAFMLRATDT